MTPKDEPNDAIREGAIREGDGLSSRSGRRLAPDDSVLDDETFEEKFKRIKKPWSKVVSDGALKIVRPLALATALGGVLTLSGHNGPQEELLQPAGALIDRLENRNLTGVLEELHQRGAKGPENIESMRQNIKRVAEKLKQGRPITKGEFKTFNQTADYFKGDLQLWFDPGMGGYPRGSYHGFTIEEHMKVQQLFPGVHEEWGKGIKTASNDLEIVRGYLVRNESKIVQEEHGR